MPIDMDLRTDELMALLQRYAHQRLFVAVLGSPDPDGLASAWALKKMASLVGTEMDVLTFEVVSRPDNIAFLNQLGIPYRQVTAKLPRVKYAGYAVVDRQNAHLPVPVPRNLPLLIHIDHHSEMATGARFTEQYPSFGSTCSIMAWHFTKAVQQYNPDLAEVRRIATALMFGIRTDTSDFLNAGAVDFEAASKIAGLTSPELVRNLVFTPLGRPFLDSLSKALSSTKSQDGLLVAYAGNVARRSRDTIGQTADFLIRADKTDVAVVFGLVNGMFVGSLRARTPEINPYEFLDDSLSNKLGFPVDCGGRTFAGGFLIDPSRKPDCTIDGLRETIEVALVEGWQRRLPRKGKSPRTRAKKC